MNMVEDAKLAILVDMVRSFNDAYFERRRWDYLASPTPNSMDLVSRRLSLYAQHAQRSRPTSCYARSISYSAWLVRLLRDGVVEAVID